MNAARQVLEKVMAARGKVDSHPGLLLQRFQYKSSTGDEKDPNEKQDVLQAAIQAAQNEQVRNLYKLAYERWIIELKQQPFVQSLVLQVVGRLIVGLGSENVLETGITLHHTYGMPIIPGSALKGLAAHYCDRVWGERENTNASEEARKYRDARRENRQAPVERQGDYHNVMFGSTEEGGCITFHDAWFVPGSSETPLVLDVMTPHHTGWNDTKHPTPPTDFDSPVPVPFVSATGKFHVAVSWCGPANTCAGNWTHRAFELVCDALCDWGVGGKTSSGYGLFNREQMEAEVKAEEENAAKREREKQEQAQLAALSPIERSMKEFLDSHPDKLGKEYMKLLKELEKPEGRFQGANDRRAVAERIKLGMQAAKEWKDKEPHGKRKKFIEGILGS
jgi:CRISPR-associated protein Cmr6